ncbi:MAG: hypothetical protein KAQ75_09960, partial [Bacteroidales bacterium]|nr:hypothetical protein [Bacteroidales bacterium]
MIYLTRNLRSQSAKHFILLLGFVLLISFVQAQTGVVNNGAKRIVNSGAVLKITGTGADYTNATFGGKDGRIDLDGKIELHGDWTNNAVSGDVLIALNTDGEVVFNGSSTQSISGSRASYFEKLTLNNTFGLSLDTNVQVVANLLLTNGIVTLNDDNLTMGVAGTITGGTFSSSKMILVNGTGSLVKLVGSTGSFTFPIGENTGDPDYSPVDVALNSHTGLSNAWISAHVTDAKHPNNGSQSEFLSRYWTLKSSGINTPNYDADFHYLPVDINGVEASIYAAEYDDASNRNVHNTVNDALNIVSVTGLSTIDNTFADYTGVDGTIPTVVITCGVSDPTNADPIPFTATFSEAVSGFAFTDITIDNGSTGAVSSGDNTVFNFNVVPDADGELTIDINESVCTDIAGNDNAAADQFSIVYDGIQPNVNLTTTADDPTNLSPFTVKVQFT